ncbi:MAG: hypothetical protein BWY11_01406 [Firmicutes bacterium ADurb.Bin182]|nr:MAG: hypothetical protein BWY11_01406 [Firmicutes bacterium ADurb.Bin182]
MTSNIKPKLYVRKALAFDAFSAATLLPLNVMPFIPETTESALSFGTSIKQHLSYMLMPLTWRTETFEFSLTSFATSRALILSILPMFKNRRVPVIVPVSCLGLSVQKIREYKSHEIHGYAYRHPHTYNLLVSVKIEEPFMRKPCF